jgi:TonB family protein
MSATTQHLLGQLADGRFPLRKLLGVSPNSAVFLTYHRPEHPSDPAPDAAIKLIPEVPSTSDAQVEHWRAAAALSHPGLLRIFHSGRCVIDGAPCLYIVTELADEDLGQLLPRRALTPDETRGVLAAVLPALDFLHERGFVHGGLKPSNIHAIGDNVKLSADRILPAGESASSWPLAAPFAPPESLLFPASDIWSLGVSVCETLTRTLPANDSSRRFTLPELPAPFAEIVRSALAEDATLRITLDQVRSLLDPAFVAKPKAAPAAASPEKPSSVPRSRLEAPDSPESLIAVVEAAPAASLSANASSQATSHATLRAPLPQIDPLSVPLSPVSPKAAPLPSRAPIPVKSLPQVNATIGSSRRVISPNPAPRSNKLFYVGAAAAVILALLAVPRYLSRSGSSGATSPATNNSSRTGNNTAPPNSSPAAKSSANPKPNSVTAPVLAPLPYVSSAPADLSTANSSEPSSGKPAAHAKTSLPANNSASASSSAKAAAPPPPVASTTRPASTAGDAKPLAPTVIRKILPEVSEKARATIRGSVRINVRVQLNPDGSVSSAELANPAASQFFADLALKAARQWQFGSAAAASSDSASSAATPNAAVIRFDFTQTSTAATAMP